MNNFQDWLYDRLRDSARPLFVFPDRTIPAASVWTGSRHWVRSFREAGLETGDRIVLALPPSPAFIQVLVAGMWEQFSLFLVNPETVEDETLDRLDARAGVLSSRSEKPSPHDLWFQADGPAGPTSSPGRLREASRSPSPDVRLWLKTSGSTGEPSIIGLSDRNLITVLESHASEIQPSDSMLSYLPWTHAFGLMMDLMLAIENKLRLIRLPSGDISSDRLAELMESYSVDHFNSVPGVIRDLNRGGFERWDEFSEGIIGGASIDERVAQILEGTNFRVGYGQTEAGPGITLGHPGNFAPGILGHPIGCSLDLSEKQEIVFRGKNAHRATYRPDQRAIERHPVPRAVHTGDTGEKRHGTYFFRGRLDHRFKLPNGRFLDPVELERNISQSIPEIRTITILPASSGFDVCVALGNEHEVENPEGVLCEFMPDLKRYLKRIHLLDSNNIPTTKKGNIDRSLLREQLDAGSSDLGDSQV